MRKNKNKGVKVSCGVKTSVIVFLNGEGKFSVIGLKYPLYICMYVCMYVCMYGWMDGWMDGWIDGWMDVHYVYIYMYRHMYIKCYYRKIIEEKLQEIFF